MQWPINDNISTLYRTCNVIVVLAVCFLNHIRNFLGSPRTFAVNPISFVWKATYQSTIQPYCTIHKPSIHSWIWKHSTLLQDVPLWTWSCLQTEKPAVGVCVVECPTQESHPSHHCIQLAFIRVTTRTVHTCNRRFPCSRILPCQRDTLMSKLR